MTANATNQIGKLQDDADQLTRKVELERRHVADLDRQIAEMNTTIMGQRANVGGVFAGRENNRKINMQVGTSPASSLRVRPSARCGSRSVGLSWSAHRPLEEIAACSSHCRVFLVGGGLVSRLRQECFWRRTRDGGVLCIHLGRTLGVGIECIR
jgi:hypothetical protein